MRLRLSALHEGVGSTDATVTLGIGVLLTVALMGAQSFLGVSSGAGEQWSLVAATNPPGTLWSQTMVYDNSNNRILMFGGDADNGNLTVWRSVNGGLTATCGDLAVTVRILEGDLNLDCNVDVTDEQLMSYRYGAFFGSLFYSKWFDIEPGTHDLDIDIKDLQKVFGRDGSTCQTPVPAQPPVDPPTPLD